MGRSERVLKIARDLPQDGRPVEIPSTVLAPDALSPIYRRSMVWMLERHAASAWSEHVPFAFWLVDVLRPRVVVELGTFTGVSYSAMCQAVQTLGLSTSCFAVDTWKGDEHAGFYSEDVYNEFRTFHDRRYNSFSRLIRSSFDEALAHFSDGTIDLLHIDGLHTYEAVQHDFESWIPKLSPNAVVLLHDTNVRESSFAVHRLWQEISHDRLHFQFLHGHGLGVLALGTDYSEPLAFLFNAARSGEQIAAVRSLFAELGRNIELNSELRQREVRINTLEVQVAALKAAIRLINGSHVRILAPLWSAAKTLLRVTAQ